MTTRKPGRTVASVAVALALAVVLGGCARGGTDGETVARTLGVPASATTAAPATTADDGTDDSDDGVGTGGTDDSAQTLPPGDPGDDAPGTDDPNGDLGDDSPSSSASGGPGRPAAKPTVPVAALLDTETVDSVAGAGWTVGAADAAASCTTPMPSHALGSRTVVFTHPAAAGDQSGRLLERVSTHPDRKAAIAAVRAIGRRLTACAHVTPTDPRVGDASVEATVTDAEGLATTVTAMALEGVVVVLSGSGAGTGPDVWAALTDIAQGNTCEATVDGCH